MLYIESSLIQHASSQILTKPNEESCGLLIGFRNNSSLNVIRFAFCNNLSNHPGEFILSPDNHRQIESGLRGKESIIGIFHSHRENPTPSDSDIINMNIHNLVWLIIGNTSHADILDLVYAAYLPIPQKQSLKEIPINIFIGT